MKILIYGLPGTGKSYLAQELMKFLKDKAEWHDGDRVRKECNDFDFSIKGGERQLQRMRVLASKTEEKGKIAICSFICPFERYRETFEADYEIWMNTEIESEYKNTDDIFEAPVAPDYVVGEKREDYDAREVMWNLFDSEFDTQAPTAQMLGRFQPWHKGHQALFERALEKEGQVALMVRDMKIDKDNPHHVLNVCQYLRLHLAKYAGKVRIFASPNITRISYGRDAGYEIEQERFDKEIEDINSTRIREEIREFIHNGDNNSVV